MNQTREQTLIEIEAFFCDRMLKLMDQEMIAEADALFEEFIVDGEEPEDDEWVFIPLEKTK